MPRNIRIKMEFVVSTDLNVSEVRKSLRDLKDTNIPRIVSNIADTLDIANVAAIAKATNIPDTKRLLEEAGFDVTIDPNYLKVIP